MKFLGSEYPKFGVFDGEEIYKVQDVLVYMPPTITYIYGLKKHLFVLIDIIDNHQHLKWANLTPEPPSQMPPKNLSLKIKGPRWP